MQYTNTDNFRIGSTRRWILVGRGREIGCATALLTARDEEYFIVKPGRGRSYRVEDGLMQSGVGASYEFPILWTRIPNIRTVSYSPKIILVAIYIYMYVYIYIYAFYRSRCAYFQLPEALAVSEGGSTKSRFWHGEVAKRQAISNIQKLVRKPGQATRPCGSSTPQLPFLIPHIPTNRGHKALDRATLVHNYKGPSRALSGLIASSGGSGVIFKSMHSSGSARTTW